MMSLGKRFVWYYGALAVVVVTIAAVAFGLHAYRASTSAGTLVLLASAKAPDHVPSFALAVHTSSGWDRLGNSPQEPVPAAPDQATLLAAQLSPGSYDALRIGTTKLAGRFQIDPGQTTPVLVSISKGAPATTTLYAGTLGVNLALAELSGQLKAMPAFSLTNQFGRPFSNSQLAGHEVVLAAFHTTCHVTCPLYTGLFLELREKLPASVLLIEATTDPWEDTPAVLRTYAGRVGANWTFLTGSPAQMKSFWAPFTVQLSGAQLHSSTLAVIDAHGYIRTFYQGVPRLSGGISSALVPDLDVLGLQELGSGGDGWGATQIEDALYNLDAMDNPSQAGGGMASPFRLPTLGGPSVSLASLRGHPVVINFWASYCTPCRTEMPMIVHVVAGHPDVRVLFIDERDSTAAANSFVRQLGIEDPVLLDQGGGVGDQYGVAGLPTTIFVTSIGSVEGRYVGQLNAGVLREHIADLESL
jgi:cytochrome oxidase Cu insertion factor (SCO1/SenC/PrrC family)/thiol-disulfide isomerase/thioredoxin